MHAALMVPSTLALLIAMVCAAIPPVIKSEYAASYIPSNNNSTLAALLAFKKAISNDPTNFLALWNTSVSPDYCYWPGVRCFKGTHDVVALVLESHQFHGTLPPQLNQLSQLASLSVFNNSLSGPIPSEFGEISSLTHLDLSLNQLIGIIPSSLANCTRLQYLDLRDNSFSGKFPSFLTTLHDLVYLDLSDSSFLGGEQLPPDIGHLSKLQFLRVSGSGLTGSLPRSIITNCTSLVWLILSDNNLTGPVPSDWSNLSGILKIRLQQNFFTGSIPATLGNCTNLGQLDLSSNFLTGEVPESLGKLAMLHELVVFSNSISGAIPTSLVNCTRLTSLQLGYNNLTGPIPSGIGRLKQALYLGFQHNTKLSGRIPDTIGDCAQLQELTMSFSELGGPLPTSLYNLSNLQTLSLSSSSFSGSLSEDVRNLTALVKLLLDGNTFVGRLPAGLGDLTELQGLDLQHNRFEGPIPQRQWRGKSLFWIDFSYNFLTGEIPDALGKLQLLGNLYLQSNRLSGAIPDAFRSLEALLNLDLSHNKLTGPIPQSLIVSVSLDLSFNNLTGTIPSSMGDTHMVITIRLAGNHLTGGIPDLTGCRGLQELDLSVNILEGEIPSTLGLLVDLQYLDLSHNKFYGALPQSLGDLLDLVSLNVSYNALQGMIPSTGIYKNSSVAAFVGNPHLCGYPLSSSCISSSHHSASRNTILIPVSICATGVGVLLILVCLCLWWRGCTSSSPVTNRMIIHDESEREWFGMQKPELRVWATRELRAATNGFDNANVIGSGGGSVCFKGILVETEKLVAIKKLNILRSQNQREARRSFVQELNILGQVRHRNLVKILGYSMDEGVMALVLELMENGNLEEFLHSESKSLSWGERLSIATDVAEGLVYLHHEYLQPIIHCDLKPENILIGSDMVAKISDFGIAKLILDHNQLTRDLSTSNFRGTLGYAAPECAAGSRISTKADVYSYGVLLIELVTGMKPTSPQLQERGITLHVWARDLLDSSHIKGLLDTAVQESIEKGTATLQQLKGLLNLGAECTNYVAKERPNIKDVRSSLQCLNLQVHTTVR